jgi:hypothetical protein
MSRGAGVGFDPALGEVDGEVDDVVERDSNDISFARELGLGDGARGNADPRPLLRPEDLRGSSADEMLLADGPLGSVWPDIVS